MFEMQLPTLAQSRRSFTLQLAIASFLFWGPYPSAARPSLSGVYAYVLETTTTTPLPILKDYVATTRSVAWVKLEEGEQVLSGIGRVCSIRISGSSPLVRTEIPAAFVRSLPPVTLNAQLTEVDGTLHIRQKPQTLVVGANLPDPKRDALPTSADDRRVVDQDNDGRPAMTVRVSGIVSGEVYVVQRSTSEWSGRRQGDEFTGRVRFETEQSVLGASSPFLKGNRATVPMLDVSTFRLLRLRTGQNCAETEKLVRTQR